MDLAFDADISPRHLSFVETGRASPSSEMLMHLSEELEIPLRERNMLLRNLLQEVLAYPGASGAAAGHRTLGWRVEHGMPTEPLAQPPIFTIRSRQVILDADLARLYGVSTKRFNEAVRRNRRRFPEDFSFRLTAMEYRSLRLRLAAASHRSDDSRRESVNWSQFATSSASRRGEAYRPWAFTEHGALMAANILRSDRADRMSVYVIRAFVQLREELAANAAILKRLAEIDRTLLQHDAALRDVYRKLMPLLRPQPDLPKRSIGFHSSR